MTRLGGSCRPSGSSSYRCMRTCVLLPLACCSIILTLPDFMLYFMHRASRLRLLELLIRTCEVGPPTCISMLL
jgi:hypothetical protein